MTSQSSTAANFRFDATSIVLHWAVALLIVGNGVLALLIEAWPRDQRPPIVNLHGVIGVLILLLSIWRLANRFVHPAPPLPPGNPLMDKLANLMMLTLWLLTIALPITGAVALWLRGRGLDFYLFQMSPPLAANRELGRSVREVHELIFWFGAVLVAGHVAAALYHQLVLKDRLLLRMKL